MRTTLSSRLKAGESLLGCFLTWPCGGLAEMVSLAAFDFLVLDSEHGSFTAESIASMIVASDAAGLPAMVRVPSCAFAESSRYLDFGAAGTLFPRADGLEAVRGAVANVKFAPAGARGLAGVRANRYGTQTLAQFVTEANQQTVVAIQIETSGALAAVEAIAQHANVDILFVGPNDLTNALGIPGQFNDPKYQNALARIADISKSAGKVPGIMVGRTEQISPLRKLGYRFFTTSDRTLLLESARSWRAALARTPGST